MWKFCTVAKTLHSIVEGLDFYIENIGLIVGDFSLFVASKSSILMLKAPNCHEEAGNGKIPKNIIEMNFGKFVHNHTNFDNKG